MAVSKIKKENIKKAKRKYLKVRKGFVKKMKELNETLVCEFCGIHCQEQHYFKDDYLTVDHIIPIAKDFTKSCDYNNFAIACQKCNQLKGNKLTSLTRNKNNYPNQSLNL
jgi:5-methylcytosine-specific restriction endonuclease McrA